MILYEKKNEERARTILYSKVKIYLICLLPQGFHLFFFFNFCFPLCFSALSRSNYHFFQKFYTLRKYLFKTDLLILLNKFWIIENKTPNTQTVTVSSISSHVMQQTNHSLRIQESEALHQRVATCDFTPPGAIQYIPLTSKMASKKFDYVAQPVTLVFCFSVSHIGRCLQCLVLR